MFNERLFNEKDLLSRPLSEHAARALSNERTALCCGAAETIHSEYKQ
jgi:hypothetical protein